ncbi:MAG: fimbria/pilus outer membrane usher protein, partial [Smithella sp.]
MLRKTCAHNNSAALSITSFRANHFNRRYVFFIIAIVLLASLPAISASPTGDKSAAANPAMSSSVPGQAKPETAVAVSSPKSTTSIVVNVTINTQPRGDFFVEMDEGKNLFIRVEDIKALKLKYAEDRTLLINEEKYAPLSALPDVSYTFDEKKLIIAIIGKTTEEGKTAVDLFSLKPASQQNIYYPRETSAFLNYGLNYIYTNTDGFQSFAITNKVGFRTGDVFFTSDSLYTKTEDSDNFVRLQSSATYERRGDLQWFVLGDQYANSGELGSTVNMGGIGFSKVYKLDPYFITQPVMDLKGSVIFPTQAEIYLDGVLIGKQSITPGSFDLKNLYSYTGSHNVQVLLRDPFGNVQKIDYMAYFSTQMLREGLQEYSYNLGVLRENYGVDSDQYGKPVFSAFHRYGVTNNFNIGVRTEDADGTYNGGIYTAFVIPRAGQFTLSLAGSSTSGNDVGGAVSLQHNYQLGSFNTNLLLRGFSRDYETVGSSLLTDSIQYEMNAGMGFLINPLGSFSVNYSENDTFKGVDTRVISANYSRVLSPRINLFATASSTNTSGDTTNNANNGTVYS